MNISLKKVIMTTAMAALAVTATPIHAQLAGGTYEVTVTNLTEAQFFTPIIAVTHMPSVSLFEPGTTASPQLEEMAEGGAVGPLADLLGTLEGDVFDVETTEGLLGPGETATIEIQGDILRRRLSLAAMLIPTNDSFVGLNSLILPSTSNTAFAPAYDAGTEENDELCANIPGPRCGGEGTSISDGEGFIYISQGMQGVGDLPAERYDWRNPVAYITVRRIPSP